MGPGGEEINVKPDSPRAIISTDALHVLLLAPKPPASTLSLAAAAAVAVAIGLRLYSKILSVFMLPEADSSDGRAVDCVCDDEDLELVAKEASTPGGDGGVLLIMPPPFLLAVLLFRLGDVCKYPLMDFIPLRLGPASRWGMFSLGSLGVPNGDETRDRDVLVFVRQRQRASPHLRLIDNKQLLCRRIASTGCRAECRCRAACGQFCFFLGSK